MRVHCPSCKQGFTYQYTYYDKEKKRQKHITSVDFMKLRKKIKEKGLPWEIINNYYANKVATEVGLPLYDLK